MSDYYPPYNGDATAAAKVGATGTSPYTYGSPPTPTAASGAAGEYGTHPISNVLLAHIVCGALATLLFLPLGALLPRIVRTYTPSRWWFPVHASVQGLIGTGLIIAAYACGRSLNHDPHGVHSKMGTALFVLVLAQSLLGAIVHWFKRVPKRDERTGRSPLNYIHIFLGLSVVIIGWFQVWYGVWHEMARAMYPVPGWNWRAGWITVVVLWFLAFIGTYIVSALRYYRRNHSVAGEKEDSRSAFAAANPGGGYIASGTPSD